VSGHSWLLSLGSCFSRSLPLPPTSSLGELLFSSWNHLLRSRFWLRRLRPLLATATLISLLGLPLVLSLLGLPLDLLVLLGLRHLSSCLRLVPSGLRPLLLSPALSILRLTQRLLRLLPCPLFIGLRFSLDSSLRSLLCLLDLLLRRGLLLRLLLNSLISLILLLSLLWLFRVLSQNWRLNLLDHSHGHALSSTALALFGKDIFDWLLHEMQLFL